MVVATSSAGKAAWGIVVFLAGIVVGRVTKSCPLTMRPDEPYPSATGIMAQLEAGNPDASAWLDFVSEKSEQGDKEAAGWLADFRTIYAVREAQAAHAAQGG